MSSLPNPTLPSLSNLSQNLLALSQPVHPLLPTIPILLPFHAARVRIAYEQARARRSRTSTATAKDSEGGLKGLVAYLVMAFGGSLLSSLLLRSPPTLLTQPLLLPLYTLIFVLPLTPLTTRLLSNPALALVLAGLDAITRTLTISTLLVHPNAPKGAGSALMTGILAGTAVTAGGVLSQAGRLTEDEWGAQVPGLWRALSGAEGMQGFVWGAAMDFWSAGLIAFLSGWLTSRDAVGGKGVTGSEGWTALETRTACTLVLGGLLGARVVKIHLDRRSIKAQGMQRRQGKVASGGLTMEQAIQAVHDEAARPQKEREARRRRAVAGAKTEGEE